MASEAMVAGHANYVSIIGIEFEFACAIHAKARFEQHN